MQRIDDLGLLVAQHFPAPISAGTAIIAHVHCLPSMPETLFRWLLDAGFDPKSLVVVPKPYSSIQSAVDRTRQLGIEVVAQPAIGSFETYDQLSSAMLDGGFASASQRFDGVDRLILLDDGGLLTDVWSDRYRSLFPSVVSVQQTTSGTWRKKLPDWRVHFVNVARSAAKTIFESALIARGVLRKLRTLPEYGSALSIGVVGLGAIGERIAKEFVSDGRVVYAFDIQPHVHIDGVKFCVSISELLDHSAVVVGCTGRNWLISHGLDQLAKHAHTLISCSSRSVEFEELLLQPYTRRTGDLFSIIHAEPPGGRRQAILNGGFPVNFDRVKEWEEMEEIQLTRSLIFAGVLQASTLPTDVTETTAVRLDPKCQRAIVRGWLRSNDLRAGVFGVDDADVGDLAWWMTHSEGNGIARGSGS